MFCFLDAESCVLLPESLLNVVDDPGGKGAATLRPYFRMSAGGVGSGAGAPAPAARSAESCWGAASCAPYSAQRQRGIAAILRRRRSGSPLGGARHAAPVQCSAAAGHRCNPAPQAKRVSPRRGAACRARTVLSGSGASLQSCAAGEAGLSSSGRGIVRPSSAQRQRGIAAILRRRRSGSLLVGARHAAPVQRSAAAGHRYNPAPQAKRVSPRRGAACRARPALSGSGASLQSCAAGEAGLSSSGRGMPRPYSAQRQRGIATILRRSDHEALPPQPRAARSRCGEAETMPKICYRTENPFVSCRVAHRFAGKRKLTGTRLPSRWA
jgi:hypothetical protein